MFEGFEQSMIDTGGAVIRVRHGGKGPPVLLLHGIPQTHVMWHKLAPRLAKEFTVVAADLRGYGDSSKPPTDPDHAPYSKRAMARDQVEVMRQLGYDRFFVVGHDRGGRCAYRMALDHPQRVLKLAVLDIVPTGEAFRRADLAFGLAYWLWFFLAQPYDLPERVLGANAHMFLDYARRLVRHRGCVPRGGARGIRADLPRPHDASLDLRGVPGCGHAGLRARRGRSRPAAYSMSRPRAVEPAGAIAGLV